MPPAAALNRIEAIDHNTEGAVPRRGAPNAFLKSLAPNDMPGRMPRIRGPMKKKRI
jgi:hypothetical protein